ncbi:DgyrCDS514 [Dimorphilus gyrociliatus]|uniref:DgyrCDS514 n=1 Tax=Dimorphilus gyrociliatus TaxID=2664684 RepID=A0A7I8V9A8_9ANNE|nr:DgyrCDS514 [Dimorphilus gyrociliatus]
MMGGLQQFFNKNREEVEIDDDYQQPRKGYDSLTTTFHDLPIPIQLYIFSLLDAKTVCHISASCRNWNRLCNDEILWKNMLLRDMESWETIQHSTHPDIYSNNQEAEELTNSTRNEELTAKEIYLRCSPESSRLINNQNDSLRKFSSIIRSMLPKKIPKIAMFGPGLETSTSGIVQQMLNRRDVFESLGMFPGQFEGCGSGFTMRMNSPSTNCTFNLITLYSASKMEREKYGNKNEERLKNNRLFDNQERQKGVYEVHRAIREVCRNVDAFIFVVDATKGCEQDVSNGQIELNAMLHDLWSLPAFPVLILSCIPSVQVERIPCIKVARLLKLHKLRKPWSVQNCDTFTLAGIAEGLSWLVERAIRTSK